ncbi:MAG: hypothetical protein HC927_11250 [Deltaproteobacteria bacterium]|nr:hypothetical protein [Deltaproteobacteria bacterium]
MMRNTDAFTQVESTIGQLEHELLALGEELDEIRHDEGLGSHVDGVDLLRACEVVAVVADKLVEALRAWIPALAPTPRELDEVLHTVSYRWPALQSERLAVSAKQLFEQLRAPSYSREPDPKHFPDLRQFVVDLRATIEQLEALPS